VARETADDFASLLTYLESYSLKHNLVENQFCNELKVWHKKLFSLLVFEAEARHIKDDVVFAVHGLPYLGESCSDFAQACFCWMHGAYKPSAIMLRSGIETFVKASVCDARPDLLLESSVFRLMDAACEEPAFQGNAAVLFDRLRQEYGTLCAVVHTATENDFGNIGALRLFPKFESTHATSLVRQACLILDRILGVLLQRGRKLLPKFHHRNRENFLDGMPPTIKGPILQSEES